MMLKSLIFLLAYPLLTFTPPLLTPLSSVNLPFGFYLVYCINYVVQVHFLYVMYRNSSLYVRYR